MATSGVDLSQVQGAATSGALANVGNINQQIEQLYGVTQSNNAMSMAMAQQQQDWSAEQAELTRQFNAAEAAKNRKWQEMMSNTAHQREVKDLIAAGLNPVLSATGGNGASVGSGAAASSVNPTGAAASPDMSMSNAFVSLLGNMLSVTTRLAEMSTSALTNQSVADKYTAAQVAAASIGADASRYGADVAASASRYGADTAASASRYAALLSNAAHVYSADKSSAASVYKTDTDKYLAEKYPGIAQGIAGSINDLAGMFFDWLGQHHKIDGNNVTAQLRSLWNIWLDLSRDKLS